jgi:hypothetical protein
MSALLPDELLTLKLRTFADLANGETCHVAFTKLIVKSDRSCFLDLRTEIPPPKGFMASIEVRRAEDASFHVTVPSDFKYTPGEFDRDPDAKLEPVASVTVGKPWKWNSATS